MKILCLGDSHTRVFNYCNRMQKKIAFDVCFIGGASAQGIVNRKSKTNALNIFEKKIKETNADKILIMLGEVDCGFVIWVRAKKKKITVDEQMNISVKNLFTFIDSIIKTTRFHEKDIIVCRSVLPTIRDSTNPKFLQGARSEVNVSQLERTRKTIEYNNFLKRESKKRGYIYIDIVNNTIGKNGVVRDKFLNSDCYDHHLNNEKTFQLWLSKIKKKYLRRHHKVNFLNLKI